MASNYFPAANPYLAPDPQAQLGKTLALRNAMQQMQYEQQMRPLQLQAEQQQVQQSQQALQLQKMSIDSQQGLMKAYTEAQGDPDKTLQLASKYSVLPKDMLAFQQQQVEYKKNLATMNETQLKNLDTQGYNTRQIFDPIANADPAQQPALWAQAKQKVLSDPDAALKYGITNPSQIPDYQGPDQIKLWDAALTGHEKAVADAQKAMETQKTAAEIPKVQAEAVTAQAKTMDYQTWLQKNPGGNYTQYEAEQAGIKAGAEAAARQPYEIQRTRIEAGIHASIQQAFQRDMVSAGKTEQQLKPYYDTMRNVDALNAAIDMAQKDNNITAARAVLGQLTGVALPPGTGKLASKEFDRLATQGNLPEQWKSKLQNIFTGDQWTDKMADDMRAYADSVAGTATADANRRVAMTNSLYGSSVQPVPQYQRPQKTTPQQGTLPPEIAAKIPEGHVSTLSDGTKWQKVNGKVSQVTGPQ